MTLPEFKQIVDAAKKEIEEITPADLKRMKKSGEDFALVDVREREESNRGVIPGATAIPRGVLELHIDQVTADKNKTVVLYCAGGMRSALAAESLKKMGFKRPVSLIGGYKGWQESGE